MRSAIDMVDMVDMVDVCRRMVDVYSRDLLPLAGQHDDWSLENNFQLHCQITSKAF